jgi:protein-disulfide isomerase
VLFLSLNAGLHILHQVRFEKGETLTGYSFRTRFLTILAGFLLVVLSAIPALAQSAGPTFPERVVGQERAPIVIDEFISLTCPHCAEFYLTTLPELEKRYVKTGKVRIIIHDYPLDGASLKAAALARCMPADTYFAFVRILYDNQRLWALSANPDKTLIKYAQLGGLDGDRAQFCMTDPGMQAAVMAERTNAENQYGVQSTPTFVFNKGVEKMEGASDITGFATTIDRMLAHSKK